MLCSCLVRFYATVVDWEYIARMREDLIERMTSKLFEDLGFSNFVVMLCSKLTEEEDQLYESTKTALSYLQPKDLGLNDYFKMHVNGQSAPRPYIRSIELFCQLSTKTQTPLQKMNCIADVGTSMQQEVYEFWQGTSIE